MDDEMTFVVTQIPPNSTNVWNTTIANTSSTYGTINSIISMLVTNMPWFFPLITAVLMLISYYAFVATTKTQKLSYMSFLIFIYMIIVYVEIGGSIITNSVIFFLFATIFSLATLLITLFGA